MSINDEPIDVIRQNLGQFACAVRDTRPFRPLWVKIKIAGRCNVRCAMCEYGRGTIPQGTLLSRKRIWSLGAELAELGTRWVQWGGGEPTMRKELPDIIEHFQSRGIGSKLTTNGTLLTDAYAARLVSAGLSQVNVSIESSVPEIHDRVVGVAGAWHKATSGLRYLAGRNNPSLKIQIKAVLTRLNTDAGLVGLVTLARDVGARRVILTPLWSSRLSSNAAESLEPSPEQMQRFQKDYLPAMKERARAFRIKIRDRSCAGRHGDNEVPPSRPRRTVMCYLPFYHCTIDFNGEVFPCCQTQSRRVLGNIADQRLAAVFDGAEAARLRRQLTCGDMPEWCVGCTFPDFPDDENETIAALLAEPASAVAAHS